MMNPLNMFERFIVVDNFYTNPELIRQYALNQSKEEKSHGHYAGVMTENSFITKEHYQIFKQLLGHEVRPSTPFNGKFRFTKEKEVGTQDIHFDPGEENCCWAGVVYLTPNVEDVEGTIFWKHKRTELEEIPRTLEGIQKYGWNGVEDLKHFLETDGVDYDKWNKKFVVPYRYNRLIMFRPWKFHSPGPGFGDTINNCRLIQTFFLSPVDNQYL